MRNNSETAHKEELTDEQYDKNIKNKILCASLPFVSDLGWSKEALMKGAESIGYPSVTHGLFSQGGADLVNFFYSECNQKLADKLKKESEVNENIFPIKFVHNAVEYRLRMIEPYKTRWPQALALMSLPPNIRQALENLKTLSDDICYYAGDRSIDFKWYSRRFIVAGLYKTTELYMMQDNSEDHKKTWKFLERRIDELYQLEDISNKTENISKKSPELISSAITTVRNILRVG